MASRGDPDARSLDVVCDLLGNQRRQYALACLMERTQAISLTELAEDVAVRENEKSRTDLADEEVRTVHTSLYHTHIPKLADTGTVEYDPDHDLIQIAEAIDLVERILSLGADGGEER